jgi:hypothetical protein
MIWGILHGVAADSLSAKQEILSQLLKQRIILAPIFSQLDPIQTL